MVARAANPRSSMNAGEGGTLAAWKLMCGIDNSKEAPHIRHIHTHPEPIHVESRNRKSLPMKSLPQQITDSSMSTLLSKFQSIPAAVPFMLFLPVSSRLEQDTNAGLVAILGSQH